MTDVRLTQIAIEEFGLPNLPVAQATSISLEMWASVATSNPYAVLTCIALEQWATILEASRGGPMITVIN